MEMWKREVKVVTKAITKCNVYKDNSEDTGNGKTPKSTDNPMKHLNVKLHHFRSDVRLKEVTIYAIDTTEQLADYLTKPLNVQMLEYLRTKVLGW